MDHPHLVFLFFMCQLFLRELAKCSRLVQLIPMDMSGYFGKQLSFAFCLLPFLSVVSEQASVTISSIIVLIAIMK